LRVVRLLIREIVVVVVVIRLLVSGALLGPWRLLILLLGIVIGLLAVWEQVVDVVQFGAVV
jgi:hypothetical protein